MAIFHCHIGTVSRRRGRSSVDAAAYALHAKLTDTRTGQTHNRINHAEAQAIVNLGTYTPDGQTLDPSQLWSAAELVEKRKDARTARTIEIALPVELDDAEQESLASKFAGWLRERYGTATTAAIHRQHAHNPHSHIVMTTRRMNNNGSLGKKTDELDRGDCRAEVTAIRAQWAHLCNRALEQAGHDARVSHLSLADQGLDRPPQSHRGVKRHALDLNRLYLSREIYEELQNDNLRKRSGSFSTRENKATLRTGGELFFTPTSTEKNSGSAEKTYPLDERTTSQDYDIFGSVTGPRELGRNSGSNRSQKQGGGDRRGSIDSLERNISPRNIRRILPLPSPKTINVSDFPSFGPGLGEMIADRIMALHIQQNLKEAQNGTRELRYCAQTHKTSGPKFG